MREYKHGQQYGSRSYVAFAMSTVPVCTLSFFTESSVPTVWSLSKINESVSH